MKINSCFLAILLPIIFTRAALIIGGGVGVAGVGIWVGGGINPPTFPSAASKLSNAYAALQAWKSAITDDPLKITSPWIGPNVCNYRGVFCSDSVDFMGNPAGKVVAAIDLNHANLQGMLIAALSLLTDLSLLHLNSNRFSGGVPPSFSELSSLTELDLSNNRFSGQFPTAVLYIQNLMYLDLRFNSFSGQIPDDLFNRARRYLPQ